MPTQEKAKCKAACLPGLERLQPAAAGLLSTTVEAGGSKVFCSQAARPGIPQEEGLCPATHPLQPRLSSPSSGAAAGLGGDVTGEGQRTGLPRMSSRMPSLLLKHCQQGRMEALGRVGIKHFQAAGTWPRHDPEERNAGPGLKQAPPQHWVLLLYFLGRLLGSQGKRSLTGAQGSAEGDAGTWAQLFPQVQKCFQVWWSGLHLCVLPVWGPRGGSKSGKVSRGTFSSVLQTPQACWAPLPSGEPSSIPLLPGNRLYVSLPRYT